MLNFLYEIKIHSLWLIHKCRRLLGIKLDVTKIPYSDCYCYNSRQGCCPYWYFRKHDRAFCSYLAVLDDNILFDQVKSCKHNHGYNPIDLKSNYNIYISYFYDGVFDFNYSYDRYLLDRSVLRINYLDGR